MQFTNSLLFNASMAFFHLLYSTTSTVLVVYLILYFVGMVLLAIISVQSDTKQASLSGVSWPQNRKVALVFAHPDDEAMFFVPTLRTLKGKLALLNSEVGMLLLFSMGINK